MPTEALQLLHDIRDQLQSIMMNAYYMRKKADLQPDALKALDDMELAVTSINEKADVILRMVDLQQKEKAAP